MLSQITALLPSLGSLSPGPGVVSGLTSCGVGPAVDGFVTEMRTMGLNTVGGVSLQGDASLGGAVVSEEEIDSTLADFAQDLVSALP
jgi:hypothetical protein